MDLRTMREYTEAHPETKSNWPTYEEVKKSSKLRHKIIFKLFNGHVKNCKDYKDSGDIVGLPTFLRNNKHIGG